MKKVTCNIIDCGKASVAKGVCKSHYNSNYRTVNKELINIYQREYRKTSKGIDGIQKYNSTKGIANAYKFNYSKHGRKCKTYHQALRHTKQKLATPKWLDSSQLLAIKNIYLNCPKGFHVDHIIPLSGQDVRGLHVPWNLQYLSKEENIKKSNKLTLEYEKE